MHPIETQRLCKSYGPHQVLYDVDLRVPPGSLFGFLGPNGAGKTTAIRILLGLLRSSAGSATVLGHDVWRDGPALRARVGYLPGDVRLYDYLTGRATLRFFARARRSSAEREGERLADVFELELDKRVRDYSRGMKQKLALIQALMHRPELLILDEPTTALDPLIRHVFYAELRAAAAAGRTVLFSSHTLSEVEELCSGVAILRAGRLIEQTDIETLRRRALRHVQLRLEAGHEPDEPLPAGLTVAERSDGFLAGTWAGAAGPLLAWLARCRVRDVTIAPPDLEDLFLAYYAEHEAEGTA